MRGYVAPTMKINAVSKPDFGALPAVGGLEGSLKDFNSQIYLLDSAISIRSCPLHILNIQPYNFEVSDLSSSSSLQSLRLLKSPSQSRMPHNWNKSIRAVFRPFHVHSAVLAALYSALANHASTVGATPTPNHWRLNTTLSNGNSANRDNDFQVLADGTQDLAALVGLFATDGVERYTID